MPSKPGSGSSGKSESDRANSYQLSSLTTWFSAWPTSHILPLTTSLISAYIMLCSSLRAWFRDLRNRIAQRIRNYDQKKFCANCTHPTFLFTFLSFGHSLVSFRHSLMSHYLPSHIGRQRYLHGRGPKRFTRGSFVNWIYISKSAIYGF